RHALALARQLDTGTVAINRFGPVPSAPFGGTKSSGIGREQGPEGFDAFLEYVSYSIPPETFADLRQQGVRVR
ncbi:MAG: aldehyde dehydrogenase family protein, partial [Actinomycetota bacterium]|nr:aldehyde dehydrogenase family protein [Actinomycetota bacterium]